MKKEKTFTQTYKNVVNEFLSVLRNNGCLSVF